MRMRPFERDILEAIVSTNRGRWFEVSDLSGYGPGTLYRAIGTLKRFGMVQHVAGALEATDRGKICLAIAIGKEARSRAQRSAA